MFMIPQDITAYHTSLNVSYSYSLPDGTEKEVTEEIYLPNTWEVNKAYNYVINIEPDIEMINVSPSVVDWDSPTETPAIGNDIAEAVDLGSSYKWASHDFGAVSPCDMGLKYTAIENGSVDAINAFTTDARLAQAPVTTLEDDKHFVTNYYCGTVVRTDTLQKYPELRQTLEKMDGLISTEDMIYMNAEVEINGKDEISVARSFLTAKGLIQ